MRALIAIAIAATFVAPAQADELWKLVVTWGGDVTMNSGDVLLEDISYERCMAAKKRWEQQVPSSWYGCKQ